MIADVFAMPATRRLVAVDAIVVGYVSTHMTLISHDPSFKRD
jgi:hypothetical protein